MMNPPKSFKSKKAPFIKKSKAMILRARQDKLLTMFATGQTVDQISMQTGLSAHEVNSDIFRATDRIVKHYTSPPHYTFAKYAVFNLSLIRQLQAVVQRFENEILTTDDDDSDLPRSRIQATSVVSAIRSQSELYDKILLKGIEFGVIENTKASKAIKNPKDLKVLLRQEILTLSNLLDEVDLSIRFHAKRIQQDRLFTPIVIKPIIGPYGILKVIPDWKFPRQLSKKLSTIHESPEEQELIKLSNELASPSFNSLPNYIPAQGKKQFQQMSVEEIANSQDSFVNYLIPPR